MIRKYESLLNAEDVLNRLMSDNRTKDIDCTAECYQNGREQGFLLYGFNTIGKAIYFADHRNSDVIRVYVGEYSMQSISDDAYKNDYVSQDNYDAIEYIIKQMQILNKIEDK